jgi:hypothetical protein
MTDLTRAANEWANRPADQRFGSLAELKMATERHRINAREADIVRPTVLERDGALLLIDGADKGSAETRLSHWSFGQLAGLAGAPPGYLRTLPAGTAQECLNIGLRRRDERGEGAPLLALVDVTDGLQTRALTSQKYARVYDSEVVDRMMVLEAQGWRVPPARPSPKSGPGTRPATEADVLRRNTTGGGLAVKVGDPIAPAGLYASDRDVFVFLVNEDRIIDDGSPEGLARGFFCWNSEVGSAALGLTTFLYKHVCGNHIVWGASGVVDTRIRHVGKPHESWGGVEVELRKYADSVGALDESGIKTAKARVLGVDKLGVLDGLLGLRKLPAELSRTMLSDAYDLAEEHADWYGAPNTAWGVVNGLTMLSQQKAYTDERTTLDRAAGKLMAMVTA